MLFSIPSSDKIFDSGPLIDFPFIIGDIAIFFDEDLIIAFFMDEICKIGSIDNNGLLGGKK